ncbi:GTP pyrophosphokinase family protein [Gemella sp. zg-1178]|uniref:GTP pyrophosphokinase n=1 Tax=Gemella sp. zg-1178 TaxID=2840372 RepID=UPI001C053088|nr:GTP pyrophosphokinase family protein [Gemella sp. zg-1178]MBU0278875.1 GTP pyrophosphokinase family protein [Gemella sp. zg-1178]
MENYLQKALENQVTNYFMSVVDTVLDYKDMMLAYDCAIKEIRTKFDILNSEFKIKHQRNPISSIHSRLKSNSSLMEKIRRRGIATDVDSIEKYIEDIAGVRVICNYIDDIYKIADSLIRQNDVELLTRKDYISNPKPNGYRSLHLIVKIPVFFADTTKEVKVEVQIRTIAMDFWATLEHQMRYKKTELDEADNIIEELRQCAESIAQTDMKMQSIRESINNLKIEKSQEEKFIEKLKKLDISII